MTTTLPPRKFDVLLVEDNIGDIVLTRRALRNATTINQISVVTDGATALDYLLQQNGYEDATRPDVILLDLNLPKMTGPEVLEQIKQHPTLRRIPVIILTSSKASEDVVRSFDLHCQSYLTKPVSADKFFEITETFEDWWFKHSTIPRV